MSLRPKVTRGQVASLRGALADRALPGVRSVGRKLHGRGDQRGQPRARPRMHRFAQGRPAPHLFPAHPKAGEILQFSKQT